MGAGVYNFSRVFRKGVNTHPAMFGHFSQGSVCPDNWRDSPAAIKEKAQPPADGNSGQNISPNFGVTGYQGS